MLYKKYFGPYEIDSVEMLEYKTPQGCDIVKVYYVSGDDKREMSELVPVKTLEAFSTDNPIDLSSLMELKINTIVPELIKIVFEYDVKALEIKHLGQSFADQLAERLNRADNYLWTKDDSSFLAGFDTTLDRTLLEAQRIIDDIPKPTDTNGGDKPE